MPRSGALLLTGLALGLLGGWSWSARPQAASEPPPDHLSAALKRLQAEVHRLQELVPDQAAVMRLLSDHWCNLWFALEQENWPLAEFYLNETRANLRWAVRVRPVRQTAQGEKVDLQAIATALENTELQQLRQAIAEHDRSRCRRLYEETLGVCHACHKASEKPYLRLHRPQAPESHLVEFRPERPALQPPAKPKTPKK
jgi:hypothetical protein